MRGAKPESAIEQTIERDGIVRKGERVIVACSGGADSVALAAALDAVRVPMQLETTLAYVHHGTRESAWQDECVVLRIGATFGMPVAVLALTPAGRDEATLREERYQALTRLAVERSATAIATAHHREDQSETVLLALFRGAGVEGLAGMRPRRPLAPDLDLIRPLLHIGADDLRGYVHAHGLPYAVDPTNADAGLRRNAVREALSALRPLFPGIDAAIARAAELSGEELESSNRSGLRRQVREALGEQEGLRDVDFAHVEAAVRAMERGSSGRFYMKPGVELKIEGGRIK